VKLKKRLRALEARVEALEQAQRWTPDAVVPSEPLDAQAMLRDVARSMAAATTCGATPDAVVPSEPLDAQALLRGVAEEYGRCYDMWGDDEWRTGVYI
jgi:hypothetical protein